MMSLRKSTLSLILLAAMTTMAVGTTACSGGDDDDDGNTPIPNPYTYCEAVWQSESATKPDYFDSVYLFGPLANWETGPHNLGAQTANAVTTLTFQEGAAGTTASVYSTNGSFTVTAPSTSLGEPVDVTNFDVTQWVLLEGSNLAVVQTAIGSLEGAFLNDGDDCIPTLDPEDCIFGASGDVSATVAGSAATIGFTSGGVGLVLCYDPAFSIVPTPTNEHQKAIRAMATEIIKSRR